MHEFLNSNFPSINLYSLEKVKCVILYLYQPKRISHLMDSWLKQTNQKLDTENVIPTSNKFNLKPHVPSLKNSLISFYSVELSSINNICREHVFRRRSLNFTRRQTANKWMISATQLTKALSMSAQPAFHYSTNKPHHPSVGQIFASRWYNLGASRDNKQALIQLHTHSPRKAKNSHG